jgi:hypothetical protein
MGFNLGAALSGAAEGASDTYFKLKKQKREDEEMQQRKEVHEAFKREQAENEQLKALAGETYGRVDQPESFRTAGGAMGPQLESAQTALPANAAEAFPAQKMYSRDQAMKDFQSRAMGINPTKAMEYETKGLQNQGARQNLKKGEYELTALERSARLDSAFESHMADTHKKLLGVRQDIQATFDTDGMNGLVKKYGSAFSDATKGNSVSLVGNALVIKDSKGKVIGQPITRPEDAVNGLSNVIGQKAAQSSLDDLLKKGLFRNSAELMSYYKDRNTMDTQTSNAESQRMSAMASQTSANASAQNAATQASIASSTIAQNNAQAAMYNAHAGVYNQTLKVAETNKEAREAMQPFLDDIAKLTDPNGKDRAEFDRLSMKAMAAGATKSADIKGLFESAKRADKSNAPEVDPEAKKAAYKELSEVGTDPKAIAAVKAKWSMVFGPTELDKAIAAKNKPPVAPAPAAASAETPTAVPTAIPTAATPPVAPVAALPASAPPVTKSTAYGKTGYQIKGVIGVFSSPQEAQAAWAQKYAPKAPAMFD